MFAMAPHVNERIALGVSILALSLLGWIYPQGLLPSVVIVFSLFFHAHQFGSRWLPNRHPLLSSFVGLLSLLAAQSVTQTAWYYASGLLGHRSDLWSLAMALGVLGIASEFFRNAYASRTEEASETKQDWATVAWLAVPLIISVGFVLRHAQVAGVLESIRTPWSLFPSGTLAAVGIAALATVLVAWRTGSPVATAIFSALTLLSVTLIAPLVYKLGYGFDGFLHRASESILATTGTLTPKPPYYIGQYVFVTWASRLLEIPLHALDTYLVPLFAAFLPFGLLTTFSLRKQAAWSIAGLALFVPLASFIVTTPQSFAYLLGILGLFYTLGRTTDDRSLIPGILLAAWSCATHPIAGLPFFGALVLVIWIQRKNKREERPFTSPLTWLILIGTAFCVPLAFYFNNLRSNTQVEWNLSALTNGQNYLSAFFAAIFPPSLHTALWPDWTVFVLFLLPFALLTCAIIAARKDQGYRNLWQALVFASLGTAFAGFLLRAAGEFTFLIEYERSNYADRLFVIANLLLLPAALSGFGFLMERLKRSPVVSIASFFVLVIAWQGAQAYAALPRHDAAQASYGWSVGSADIEAVRFIEHDANGRAYTVLANQSVSAAAVQTYGFKRYAGDVFYYPIPTGGPLYEVYLRAVGNTPTREAVEEARELGKTDLVYVVLNQYWWDAERVAEELSALADTTYAIQNGKVNVYRFDFNKAKNR